MNESTYRRLVRLALFALGAGLSGASTPARADISFLGVAAGDATSGDAVLWTRAVDTNAPAATPLTAQVTTDPTFGTGVMSFSVSTDPTKDYTAKLTATGLVANTKYFYRFTSGAATSITGTFKTAPDAGTAAALHFAFSGDCDGLIRPYALASVFPQQNLDFFVFDGDTIYETASAGSPAVTSSGNIPAPSSTGATQAQLFGDYSRKYREQFIAVNPGGQNCLQPFFAAQGNYTLLDNHELGNKQYINGGAPPGGPVGDMSSGAGLDARGSSNDVNTTGTFMNKAVGFQTLEQVWANYQPVKEDRGGGPGGLISAPGDARTDGTKQYYYAQQWGKNAIFINVDDRSYRDIRMKTAANADDTGARAGNPNRTMAGATQLAWLEQTLLNAQNAGLPWKFVVISDPIDQIGPIGGALTLSNLPSFGPGSTYAPVSSDGGKSWMGGYRAERNALLKFIADNKIRNVVFMATDDHQNRINELSYSPTGQTEVQSTYVKVPYCFEIVCGPLGATGPDLILNHTYSMAQQLADSIATAEKAAGIDPIGLSPNYPGLHNVTREGDPQADALRQPVDFYSPDTFNFNTLDVTPDGKTLTVKSIGLNSYAQNSFPEYDATNNPARQIFSFQIDAAGDDLAAIDHFIVIYQENWSFDGLYGNFPGANGIANASPTALTQLNRTNGLPISSLGPLSYDPVSGNIPIQNPPVPLNGTQDKRFLTDTNDPNSACVVNTLAPYNLLPYVAPADLTGDIVHRYWQEQFQINEGAMNMFVTWSDNPGLVLSHFDASGLPEGLLAQQYVMCDNFFHSAFGGSFLNHQILVAAQAPVYLNAATLISNNVALLDSNGFLALNAQGKIIHDGNITPIGGVAWVQPTTTFDKNYAVNTIFSANLASSGNPAALTLLPSQNDSNPADTNRPYIPTIGDALSSASVTWKWYSGGFSNALDSSPSNPLHYGFTSNTVSSLFQWHHQAFAFFDNFKPFDASQPDGRNPVSAAHLQDETQFFADVTNNTLPAVSFIKPLGPDNEHPGYASLQRGQQHVADIVAAVQSNPDLWAHSAIIVTYDEHGGRWDHVTPPTRDIWGPGSRVPGIVISPLSKSNYVDHTQYETLSILKTIEQRFGLAPLTTRDGAANSLAPAFNSQLTAIPSSVQVTRGGFSLDRRTGHFMQQVQLTNVGSTPIPAPLLLVLDSLSVNATLFNPSGTTANIAPLNSPYVSVGVGGDNVLAAGESVTVTLEFVNPSRAGITYTARVLAGTPAP
jgi:acid phosphatase